MKKSRGQLDAESALEYLHERGVSRFVHFTSIDNLESILDIGLIPRSSLDNKGVAYDANDDLRLDGLDHVNLSITHPNTSFFYKIRNKYPDRYYAVLSIRPDILLAYPGDNGRPRYSFSNTNTGIGKAYLSAGDNEKAMEYLKRGMNRDYYSVAFKRYRNDVLKSNINYILTGIIAVIVAIVVVVKVIRPRRNQKNGRRA